MSSPSPGGTGTILPHSTQSWHTTWTGGWPGNAVIDAQALNPGSKLVVSDLGASMNGNGTYTWFYSVTNEGSLPVNFQIQVATV
jgi:hypothetical protein